MDKCFNKNVCNILKSAENEMIECYHPYVGSEHLLLALLKVPVVSTICKKYNLIYSKFKKELIRVMGKSSKKSEIILYTPLLKLIIEKACEKAINDNKEIDETYLLSSLLEEKDGIAIRILENLNINNKEILKELKKSSIIYQLGQSLNDKTSDRIYLREKEISEIIQILLRKNKNNPLLVGHSGVGKTAIVEELAQRIKEGNVPIELKNYEIIMVNTSTLVSGTKYRGEFEEKVINLVNEIKNSKNIILFIDEIHTLVKTGASDGSIDAANILKPYLARGEIKVIGATTSEEYNMYIKKDPALVRRFSNIVVNEPTDKDMKIILHKLKPNYEKYYKLKIDSKCINEIIKIANERYPNSYNPDKSIELLDRACSKKIITNHDNKIENNILLKEDILNVSGNILCKKDIKVYNDLFKELKDKYNERMLKNIINFLKNKNKDKNSLIINGDIEKEKRNVINIIAKKLNINIININCLDYNDEYSISKFINNDYLYNKIEDNPNSFIIFNNYNCCNKILYNYINSMINNEYITNTLNEIIYINNSYIFLFDNSVKSSLGFTSNNNLLFTN